MGRTAVVSIVDGCQIQVDNILDIYYPDAESSFVILRNESLQTIAAFHRNHVKYIAFRDEKPEPPEFHALGHEDVKKTELSAGDRAVVIRTDDHWNCLTVDIIGPYWQTRREPQGQLYATKRRGEVWVRCFYDSELRPVTEERRNESR